MSRYRRRGISFGSVFMLLLTILVAGGCVVVLPKLAGNMNQRIDAQQLADVITSSLDLPQLSLSDIPIFPQTSKSDHETAAPAGYDTRETIGVAGTGGTLVPTATPEPEKRTFTLAAGGTLSFDSGIRKAAYHNESKTYDFGRFLSEVSSEFDTDIALATLENTMVEDAKLNDINITKDVLRDLVPSGIDMLSLGHEHILDQGLDGLIETTSAVRMAGFSVLGVKTEREDAQNPLIVNIRGIQVAFLHYTDVVSNAGKKAIKAEDSAFALPQYDPQTMVEDIQAARSQGTQVVIVMMHWGSDNQSKVTVAMTKEAQAIADAGADIILGAHGQAVLPIAYLTGSRPDGTKRPTLVCYSLGALLTSSRDTPDVAGMLLKLQITFDPVADRVSFDRVQYVPTYIWRYKESGKYVYQVVASDKTVPEAMEKNQKDAMIKALDRINKLLADSPAKRIIREN